MVQTAQIFFVARGRQRKEFNNLCVAQDRNQFFLDVGIGRAAYQQIPSQVHRSMAPPAIQPSRLWSDRPPKRPAQSPQCSLSWATMRASLVSGSARSS